MSNFEVCSYIVQNDMGPIRRQYIQNLQYFGWSEVSTEKIRKHHGGHHYYVLRRNLQRDLNDPRYKDWKFLEEQYFTFEKKWRTYKPIDGLVAFLLFCLAVFPVIIYLVYKSREKKEVAQHNSKISSSLKKIIEKAKRL